VEDPLLSVDDHGVASIGPALVANNDVDAVTEKIDDLALSFVAPLGSKDAK
jgi:hypothetical protein